MATRKLTDYRALIVQAAQAGIPPIWIAYELGITNNTVKATLSQERARGTQIPRFKSPGRRGTLAPNGVVA